MARDNTDEDNTEELRRQAWEAARNLDIPGTIDRVTDKARNVRFIALEVFLIHPKNSEIRRIAVHPQRPKDFASGDKVLFRLVDPKDARTLKDLTRLPQVDLKGSLRKVEQSAFDTAKTQLRAALKDYHKVLNGRVTVYDLAQQINEQTTRLQELNTEVATVEIDRKSTRLNFSHVSESRMPSSA